MMLFMKEQLQGLCVEGGGEVEGGATRLEGPPSSKKILKFIGTGRTYENEGPPILLDQGPFNAYIQPWG